MITTLISILFGLVLAGSIWAIHDSLKRGWARGRRILAELARPPDPPT